MSVEPESAQVPEKYLGELEPLANLLPPEFYQQNTSEKIEQVKALGRNVAVSVKTDEEHGEIYDLKVYNQSGQMERIPVGQLGLNLKELLESHGLVNEGNGGYWTGIDLGHPHYLGEPLSRLQPEARRRYFTDKFVAYAKKNGFFESVIMNPEKLFFSSGSEEIYLIDQPVRISAILDKPDLLLVSTNKKDMVLELENGKIARTYSNLALTSEELGLVKGMAGERLVGYSKKSGVVLTQGTGSTINIRTTTGEIIHTYESPWSFIADEKGPILYLISKDGKKIQKLDLKRVKAGIWRPEDIKVDLPQGANIEKFLFDPNGNFLAVEYELNGQGTIAVVDKDSGQLKFKFEGVTPKLDFDSSGNLIFVDKEGRLRKVQTNFGKIPPGSLKGLTEVRQRYLEEMAQKIQQIQLAEGPRAERKVKVASESDLIKQFEGRISSLVAEQLAKAQTVEELGALREQLQTLMEQEEFANFPEAFASSERAILQKENSLRVAELEESAGKLHTQAGELGGLEEAAAFNREVARLKADRANVAVLDPAQRQMIDARLKTLEGLAQEAMKHHLGELGGRLDATFNGVVASLQTAANEAEIGQIYTDSQFVLLNTLLTYVTDPIERQAWQQKIAGALASQRRAVVERSSQIQGPQQLERASAQQITQEILGELERQIQQAATGRDLDQIRRNPLTVQLLEQARRADPALQQEAKAVLERLVDERRSTLETERELEKVRSGEVIRFNGDEFPIFSPPPTDFETRIVPVRSVTLAPRTRYSSTREYLRTVRRRPGEPHHTGRTFRESVGRDKVFTVEFVDKRGKVYRPKTKQVTEAELDRFLKEETVNARHHFETSPRFVPKLPPDFKMTPYYRGMLSKMARELNIQLEIQEGMLILQGPAGVGKNMLFDVLAALSNRELFIVPCHAQMDKEDLTYTIEFDPKRGTLKKESSLIEALSTPGAIVVFNEVNTAPTGVVKMANPLADYQRTLFLSLGGEKKAIRPHPSVLLAGVENPENYLGTKPLAQDFKSRSTIVEVDYPPPRDEASILAAKIDSIKGLQLEEFERLWDYVVGRNAASGGDQFASPDRESDIRNLNSVVRVAEAIRSAHSQYMRGESDEVVNFDFTLRETKMIAMRYNLDKRQHPTAAQDVKQVIKDSVLPKIADLEERERVSIIIDNT